MPNESPLITAHTDPSFLSYLLILPLRVRLPWMLRKTFLLLIAGMIGVLTACAQVAKQDTAATRVEPALRSSPPEDELPSAFPIAEPGVQSTVLGDVEDAVSGATFVRFRIVVPEKPSRRTITLAAVLPPDRTPTVRIDSFRIRQTFPWDTDTIDDRETSAALGVAGSSLNRLTGIKSRGIARRSHLYEVTLNTDITGTPAGHRFTLTEATLLIEWKEPWRSAPLSDQTYENPDGPWMQTLSGLVINPSALQAYGDPAPPRAEVIAALPAPDWQPLPVEGVAPDGWLKIPVEEEGLVSIDWATIKESGWDPETIAPPRLRLYNEGVEVPTELVGGFAQRFTIRDHILFWGVPSPSTMTRTNEYFLGLAPPAVSPRRFAEAPPDSEPSSSPIAEWPVVTRIEENKNLETKEGNFLSIRDMRLVWEPLPVGEPLRIPFDLPGHVGAPSLPGSPCSVRVTFYIGKGSVGPNADVKVTLNGSQSALTRVTQTLQDPFVALDVDPATLRETGNELEIVWEGTAQMATIFLDAIEVRHVRRLDVSDGPLILELADRLTSESITLQVAAPDTRNLLALDLSDPRNPVQLRTARDPDGKGADVLLGRRSEGRVGLFDKSQTPAASPGHPSPWQPWRAADPDADSVIITYAGFRKSADALAAVWTEEGRKSLVVDVESLFDAYTHGLLDPAAIRMFLADASTRWSRKPEAVLLLGDCTSDFRNQARNQVVNYVPSHSNKARGLANQDHYASDLWFASVFGEDNFADLLIGRLSVNSEEDADVVVDKQAESRSAPPGIWKQAVGLVADHGNFADVCEDLRLDVLPPTVLPRLAYLDREPFEDNFYLEESLLQGDEVKVSPATTRRIQSLFDEGSALVAFFGHGSPNIWSDQRIWFGGDTPNSDNRRLTNAPRYPLVFNGTCNTGAIDYPTRPWNVCISEDMMRQPGGGALACFVPSAPGYTSNHKTLAELLFRGIYNRSVHRVGPLCELARMAYQILEASDDHSQMFNVLGDPLAPLPSSSTRVVPVSVEDGAAAIESANEQPAGEFKSARLFVIGPDGEPLGSPTEIATGATQPRIRLDPPVHGRVQLIEWKETENKQGDGAAQYVLGGAAFVGPARVTVNSLTPNRPPQKEPGREDPSADPDSPIFLVTLTNLDRTETVGTVAVENRAPDGEWSEAGSTTFRLPSQGRRVLPVEANLSPGAHLLRATVRPSDHVVEPAGQAGSPVVFVVPDPAVQRDIAVEIVSINPEPQQGDQLSVSVTAAVANLGRQIWNGGELRLTAEGSTARHDDETTPSMARDPSGAGASPSSTVRPLSSPLQPGVSVQQTFSNISVQGMGENRWHVSYRSNAEDWSDDNPGNDSATVTFDPSQLPDLAWISGSMTLSPESPTEGETVFLTADLENRGLAPTPSFIVKGFSIAEDGKDTAMQDRANPAVPTEEPLAPRERRTVRIRWDPRNNLDTEKVALVIDAANKVADLDRANNRIECPIHVRTKWKLIPLGIAIADVTTTSAVLTARIRNEGETPARFVEVAFYPDENHAKDNQLGTVIQEIIEPGQTAEFRFLWRVRPEDVGRKVQPSYQAYIKGSMLRVTGTAVE